MNALLKLDPNEVLKGFDALKVGAQTLALGLCAVFAVLIIIWISLILLKFFLHDIPAQRKAEKAAKPIAPTPAPEVTAPTVSSNDEIVAVIAAAIAAAESEESGLKFRVVSFKKK